MTIDDTLTNIRLPLTLRHVPKLKGRISSDAIKNRLAKVIDNTIVICMLVNTSCWLLARENHAVLVTFGDHPI